MSICLGTIRLYILKNIWSRFQDDSTFGVFDKQVALKLGLEKDSKLGLGK